jgi:hypothetical protein
LGLNKRQLYKDKRFHKLNSQFKTPWIIFLHLY